jgi:signal transduction histidine kinase
MGTPGLTLDMEVPAHDLPWPERIPQAIGVFALAIALVIVLQRHEFTSPNLGLLAIGLAISPWVVDIFCEHIAAMRERRFELPVFIGWTVVVLAGVMWLVAGYPVSNDVAPFLITLLVGEMSATAGPKFGAIVGAICVTILLTYSFADNARWMYIWAFAFTIAWMGGAAFRRQVQIAFELAQAQTRLSEQAVEEERHRLARDIHDLIAHSLAVTMLQLSGARLALKAGDTEEALAALEDAEAAGRSAMTEIHRTVGLLGSGGAEGGQRSTPIAADLPGLIESFRDAGLKIDFELAGSLVTVPLAAGLASYRVVQESLANAVKHAPGAPVQLSVSVTISDIRIWVVNPVVVGAVSVTSGGNGLRGMAERAELLGGVAAAGNGDGTWKVDARIPWEAQPS